MNLMPCFVELWARDQPRFLVDQIGEGDALVLIFLGDGHDETEVERTSFIERSGSVACPLRRVTSSSRRLSRILADLPQILIQRSLVNDGASPYSIHRWPLSVAKLHSNE